MIAILLGLASGLVWGVADFCAGLLTRRVHVVAAALVTQALGLGAILLVALAVGPPTPGWERLGWAALAGVASTVGVLALFRGLATGAMSLVAPVSALGVTIPVGVGLLAGESPGPAAAVGMAFAVAGAVLTARAPGPVDSRGVGAGLLAAIAFGAFYVMVDRAADGGVIWTAMAMRLATVPLLGLVALASRPPLRVPRAAWPLAVAAGTLDLAAMSALAAATRDGEATVAAVLAGLYPVGTIALAALVLHERLSRWQAAGVAAALLGVVLITAGSAA